MDKNKLEENNIDKKIAEAIKNRNKVLLMKILDLSEKEISSIFDALEKSNYNIEATLLQKILFLRDRKIFGLTECKLTKKSKEELKLPEEFSSYNYDITKRAIGNIKVLQGKNKDGKNVVFYYYNISDGNSVRQMRILDSFGNPEVMQKQMITPDGTLKSLDNAFMAYKYDENGRKKAGIYIDEITGVKYYEYDNKEKISLIVGDNCIKQNLKYNNESYSVGEGYITPTDISWLPRREKKMSKVDAKDIERCVVGPILDKKEKNVLNTISLSRKEKVLDALKKVEIIFKSISSEIKNFEPKERLKRYFKDLEGIADELKFTEKDASIMLAMRKSVSSSVVKNRNVRKELNNKVKNRLKE